VVGLGLFSGASNRREQAVPLTITRAQRDAIYEMVISLWVRKCDRLVRSAR
jgi:hypothetical protein